MKIAVISDLHLGNGTKSDQFGHDDGHFLKFLDHLEDNFERIVLLGDVYETLTTRGEAQVAELQRCKAAHAKIAARFERPAYRYLHGNHDLVAGHVDSAPDALHLHVDGQRIVFMHGHQFDWLAKKARTVHEWFAWFGGLLGRLGMQPVLKAASAIERMVSGFNHGGPATDPTQLATAGRFQRAAMGYAEAQGLDLVVTGHTHLGVVTPFGDRLFLNSGTCEAGRFSFLAMDTASSRYTVETGW
jgi:UDP-2,3-diacylglucosamine pyrophosphatase LpxH